jgi:hypothetical protein
MGCPGWGSDPGLMGIIPEEDLPNHRSNNPDFPIHLPHEHHPLIASPE